MKTLELKLDHFHFSGSLDPDILMVKKLDFDLEKTSETIFLTVKAPILNKLKIEVDFIAFRNNVLSMNILSDRKIAEMLFGFLRRFLKDLSYLDLDYPTLKVRTDLMMKELNPNIRIKNIDVNKNIYILDLELD
ncbi:MAG: hypothetical protein WCT23_05580 [Candidatus Neomarinimicrobiota bacterium]